MNLIVDPTISPLERLSPESFIHSQHELMIADHVNRYRFCQRFVAGQNVLDAACGIGFGSNLLALAGAQHVEAIDISSEAIATAQQHYAHPEIHFAVCDLLRFSETAAYDVIISFETIEHIADTEKYLQVMHDCLKPGGRFFVSTPNRNVSNPRATRFDKPNNPFHHFELTRDELAQTLSAHFAVEDIFGQRPYYFKGTTIRTAESILTSGRLRNLLHLPKADYVQLARVRRTHSFHEPVFFVAQCRKVPSHS